MLFRRKKKKKENAGASLAKENVHLAFDLMRAPSNIVLFPETFPNCAKVKSKGWGYVGSVVGSKAMQGRRHYWEYILEEKGFGLMLGVVDADLYNPMDGVPAGDTEFGWMYYANNGRYFHNKTCTGQSHQISREGDSIGILYQVQQARKPLHYDASMGEIIGEEAILIFFKNGEMMTGGHVNLATYETKSIQEETGTKFVTTATPVPVFPVVDFYAEAAVKITRGNVQDQYVHSLTKLVISNKEDPSID